MQTITSKTLMDTLYYGAVPVFKYQIVYPFFTTTCNPSAAQTVNNYYVQFAKRTEEYCRTVLYPQAVKRAPYISSGSPPFNSYHLDINYKITYNSGCITSLYTDTLLYMGGALGEVTRSSDTWNFNTGLRLQPGDIFPVTPDALDALQTNIEHQITERLNVSPGSFFDDYPILLRNTFNQNNYYLKPGSYVIFYQEYDIAPSAAGIPEFSFPLPYPYYKQ